jgi:phosphatidylglycerophosphate synthase
MDATRPTAPSWIHPVPNILSGMRLAFAAVFPFLTHGARPWALAAAGLSDLVDGWIARRFNAATWVGGILDAVADKAFVVAALATQISDGHITLGEAALLLSRDWIVLLVAAYGAARRRWHAFRHMPSRFFGKLTTALLFPLFVAWFGFPNATTLHEILFWAATGSSVLAALDYSRRFARAVAESRRGIEPGHPESSVTVGVTSKSRQRASADR